MRNLKVIRIFLATLFAVAAVAYLFIGPQVHPMAEAAPRAQIIPSAIAMSLGAILVWLPATFLFGRIYCSTVCPIGSLLDLTWPLRRRLKRNYHFRWKQASPMRWYIAALYLASLVAGISAVAFIVEPWNIMRNMASIVRHDAVSESWLTLGVGGLTGICAGIVSLLFLLIAGICVGRDFCNTICPIGSGLAMVSNSALYHIEIDPDKCTGCLKCEDRCPASCIQVTTRRVDDARCIRCFECLSECEEDAIRFQSNRNRRQTPLMESTDS